MYRAMGYTAAILLLASGLVHLRNPYRFLDSVYGYRIVEGFAAEALAGWLPLFHLTLAAGILTGLQRRAALRWACLLFSCYAAAQMSAIFRGLSVGCGCFGASATPIGLASVGLAVVGAGASWFALPRKHPPFSSTLTIGAQP